MIREIRDHVFELKQNPPPFLIEMARDNYNYLQTQIKMHKDNLNKETRAFYDYFPIKHSPTLRKLLEKDVLSHLEETFPIKELEAKARMWQRIFAPPPPISSTSAQHLSPAQLDQLKMSRPIEDLYEFTFHQTSTLTRLKAPCPFHEEQDPSFVIYTQNNSFYCYGCNKGGDVITFLMLLHNMTFKEAINALCPTH